MSAASAKAGSEGKRSGGSRSGSRAQSTVDESAGASETGRVSLPFGTAWFGRAKVQVPRSDDLVGAVHAVREYLSSPQRIAYYGGLGVLAALSIVEWPVAAAIGVGTIVAQQSGGSDSGPLGSGASSPDAR